MQFVHGRARHPQSQGSTERANGDVKPMLAAWMRENKSLKWSIGCKFVQLQKNHAHHSANKCSPYKATFGIDTPLGLSSVTAVPREKWAELKTAKDLYEICGIPYDDDIPDDDGSDDVAFDRFDQANLFMTNDPVSSEPLPGSDEQAILIEAHANAMTGVRASVAAGQAKQAQRMLTRSDKYLAEVEIGDFVVLPIPTVDRSVSSAPNIICRIIDIDFKYNMYELACQAGVLEIMYARNGFEKLESTQLGIEVRMDVKVNLREVPLILVEVKRWSNVIVPSLVLLRLNVQ